MSDQIPGMPATSELLAGLAAREHDGKTPDHYAGSGVTADEALRSMLEAPANVDVPPMALFWWALAFKYVWRLFAKGQGARDCAKARVCLARLTEEMVWGDDGE